MYAVELNSQFAVLHSALVPAVPIHFRVSNVVVVVIYGLSVNTLQLIVIK